MTNLMTASNQWANRPDDQRFSNLSELFQSTHSWHEAAKEYTRETSTFKLQPIIIGSNKLPEPALVSAKGGGAIFTHFGFGQFCRKLGAPSDFMREIPAELACQNMNHLLGKIAKDDTSVLLMHENGGRAVRAVTSEKYSRIWNDQIVQWMMENLPQGWRVPPARPARANQKGTRMATNADVLEGRAWSLSIKAGDQIAPAGLYASDHDMFIFMVDQTRPIEVGNEILYRGFFIDNNEVGSGSLVMTQFLYDAVCGNHIVWGARNVIEYRVRHIGPSAYRKFREYRNEIQVKAENTSSDEDIHHVRMAMAFKIADTKDEVKEAVYRLRTTITMKQLDGAWDMAKQHEDIHGDPRTAWGMMSGITRLSQTTDYQDRRDDLDRAGRKVLEMAF